MKLPLLEFVQDIMNDMDSDAVNSISDTEESLQIAQIVKTTYFEMIGRRDWPHLSKFGVLGSLSDSGKPTHLTTPENMIRLDWFKYNKIRAGDTRNRYTEMQYLHPDEFLQKTNDRDLSKGNVIEVEDFGGARFQILNDRAPEYYTSFDDNFVVLDAYDLGVEDTLQSKNTQARIYTIPPWYVEDTFVPDLPLEVFPALLAESKSVASFKLNDKTDEKAEQQSVRQQKRLSSDGWKVSGGIRFPNYGRSPSRVSNNGLFDKGK